MFSKKFRLPAKTSFAKAQTFSTQACTFRVKENMLSYNRYGFVVSKKIDTKATERNLQKRRVRAILEALHPVLRPGHDLLFILKPQIKQLQTQEIKKEIEAILRQAKVHI